MTIHQIDTGTNMNELMANKVIDCATRHTELLCKIMRKRPERGDVRANVEARFLRWRKKPKQSKLFLALEHNPGMWIPQSMLARVAGFADADAARGVIADLRQWTIAVVDEEGNVSNLAPFKRGRELWSKRRVMRPDGELVEGGVSMFLLYHGKSVRFKDVQDFQYGFIPNMLSDKLVLDGGRETVRADESVTEEQLRALFEEADQIVESKGEQVVSVNSPLLKR